MTMMTMIADEFLDQWKRGHAGGHPDYERLKTLFAVFAGRTDINCVALRRELHERRKARGWPDPRPRTLEPSIEDAIMELWISGIRD